MSRLRIFSDTRPATPELSTENHSRIQAELDALGVRFERWPTPHALARDASHAEILDAYRVEVDELVKQYGFRSIDVARVTPDHPDRVALRGKFLEEHSHMEDEVRFFVSGSGLFSLHMRGKVYEVLCEAGDLISVPDATPHWFDMGPEPDFTAIRFFTEPDGWVGYFTGSDIARRFPRYEAGQAA